MTATIPRMARPRGEVTSAQARQMATALNAARTADAVARSVVVRTLREGASFAEVSKATGLSTNTLQRWKKEADQ